MIRYQEVSATKLTAVLFTFPLQMIAVCDQELDEQLTEIRKALKRPSATYTSINGVDNLIETRTGDAKKVRQNRRRLLLLSHSR